MLAAQVQGSASYDLKSGTLYSPLAGMASITVYDMRGQAVQRLNAHVQAGSQSLSLRLPGRGVYLMRIQVEGQNLGAQRLLWR